MIGLLGWAVGLAQFWIYGSVSIRPGHDPVSGDGAVEMLVFLFAVSAAFLIFGIVMVHRARRMFHG
jgi:hypothetical protein